MAKKVKRKTERKKVLVSFIHDFSGSMGDLGKWPEYVNGAKAFVADLKSDKNVEYFMSLTMFDTVIETPFTARPIHEIVDPLAGYRPRGGTALYDALGVTLQRTAAFESDFDKIIYIIVTDGAENSSRVWTKEALHTLIDAKLTAGKSTFEYLGAQPETWDDAKQIGLVGCTVQYDAQKLGATEAMYNAVSDGVKNFSSSAVRSTKSLTGTWANGYLSSIANLKIDTEAPPKPTTK